MRKTSHIVRRFLRETKGAVMVEFAVVCLVFLLIIAGIMDLGHAFYMRQVVTNASREGARYGVVYQTTSSGARLAPVNYSPSIMNHILVTNHIGDLLPDNANPQVTVTGAGYSTGTSGANLEVTVSAIKTWFVLGNFIPTLGSQITLAATTVMQCE
ncbi:MAG: TadE/TadG family type IV pilus assembly protein [Desulfobaccales bacterium]